MGLFAYKMTHDTGFAPNPFWGALTLATCKPGIRKSKREGDWVAGFTSGSLCGDPVGGERLIYLMRVARKLTIADYFMAPEFQIKIPSDESLAHRRGDNIYRPKRKGATNPADFEQLQNDNHFDVSPACTVGDNRRRDVSGKFVLIANEFAYFGGQPLNIPPFLMPNVPTGMSQYGGATNDPDRAKKFIDFVLGAARGQRVLSAPHDWEDGDEGWNPA